MTNAVQRIVLTTFLIVCSVLFIYHAFALSDTGRYMPLIVGIPLFILGLMALRTDIQELRVAVGAGGSASPPAEDDVLPDEADDDTPAMSEKQLFAILAGLFAIFWFFGLFGATLLFIWLYMVYIGKESRVTSTLVTLGTTAFVYLIFVQLLQSQIFRGYFFRELLPMILGG